MSDDAVIERTEYLSGVPCWVDTEQEDVDAAAAFYGGVFGWELEDKMPPGAGGGYLVATLDGRTVAAIASPTPGVAGGPSWNTYVSVTDVDATAARAVELGATLVVAPVDTGPPGSIAGRWAAFIDADGAHLRLWQPGYRHGAQLVNAAGSWNSSDLTTSDVARAQTFYGALFGWEADPIDFGDEESPGAAYMWRRPGYGDFLAIRDPDIKRRHAEPWVPAGFSDAIGWMTADTAGQTASRWTVTFSVESTDAVAERAVKLGATVVSPPNDSVGGAVRTATFRDPQGAELTVGTYDPNKMQS